MEKLHQYLLYLHGFICERNWVISFFELGLPFFSVDVVDVQ